jgi:hypothetical protein
MGTLEGSPWPSKEQSPEAGPRENRWERGDGRGTLEYSPWSSYQYYFLNPRERGLYREPDQLVFHYSERTVHFLSSIYTGCIPCWTSCRGLIVLETGLRSRAPLHTPTTYKLSFSILYSSAGAAGTSRPLQLLSQY